jgi:PAS domain S-box-containing protein
LFRVLSENRGFFRAWLIILIGVISLAGFFCASYFEKRLIAQNKAHLAEEVQLSLSDVTSGIHQSLELYSLELKSIRAFIYSLGLDQLSYSRFYQYAQESNFEKNYPGSRGFGFIRFVAKEDEPDYLRQVSVDRSEEFQIKSLSEHTNSRFVIEYIEPEHKNSKAIGLDIGSEVLRRSAALASAHQNKVTLTAPITLVQANAMSKHGFLLLYPVYTTSLNENIDDNTQIYGWVYAPLLIDEILLAIQQQKTGLNLTISDTSSLEDEPFFEGNTDSNSDLMSGHHVSSDIELFGRSWRVKAYPTESYVSRFDLRSPSKLYFQTLVIFAVAILFLINALYLAKRHLQGNRQKYELAAVVENGVEGTIGLDENFCIKCWNDAAKNIFGLGESALKRPFIEWLEVSYSADYLIDLFKRVSKGEAVKGLELKIISELTDEEQYLHLNFQPILQKGKFWGANVSMVDLTHLRALQSQLEEKNYLLSQKVNRQDDELKVTTSLHESLLQGADFLIITTDINGVITSANRKLEELLDYSHHNILDQKIEKLFQKQYLSSLSAIALSSYKHYTKDLFDALVYPLKHQARIEGEFTFQHKNGDPVELQLIISTIKNTENEVFGYLFIADDLRDQKALRFDLELVSAAIQSSEDILLWLDQSGSICNSNPFAQSVFAYTEYEMKHLKVDDLLSFDFGETWSDILSHLQDHGTITKDESLVSRQGYVIPCLVTMTKLDVNGELFVFLAAKDISERLVKEQALEDALDFAAQANASKDQFLANMGHELRTPLNEVHGSLQLLQLTDLSLVQMDYLSQAKTSVRLLTQSIDDVLDCGEIIRNKLALNIQEVNLLDLLNSVGQALAVIAEDKNIEVHFDLAEDLPHLIKADSHRLYQLLMCLMTNAIKFTFEGDVILRCEHARTIENEYELSFQVIDTGIGISDEKQKQIFEFFSQAEMGADRSFGGLGLGLTISKNIVELMSGEISCQSEIGKGTIFTFNILVEKSDLDDAAQVKLPENSSLKVLVVDDNKISLSVLSKLIAQLGWQVEIASGAQEAVTTLQHALDTNQGFDLALVDWNMPEKSGLDLVKDIRKQFSPLDMPILVMVTAYTRKMLSTIDNRDVEDLLSAFLTKPITKTMLLDLVQSVLSPNNSQLSTVSRSRQKLHGLNILLVEDNETNQFIAKNLLQSQGARVVVASEGEEAWYILNKQTDKFDIILMDIQMPGWDGYRATKEIRSDERFNDLPILAMTANVLASDKRKCFDAGMNGHIGKPFELIQLVQEILSLTKKPGIILSHHIASKKAAKSAGLGLRNEQHYKLSRQELVALKEKTKINIQESLQRFSGSEELYIRSLGLFVSDLERYLNVLTRSNSSLELDEIKVIFHTLKGTASLLGFTALSDLALECEQLASMLADKGARVEPLCSLVQLMENMRVLIESIFETSHAGVTSAIDEDTENQGLDILDIKTLQELKAQLESSNMQAVELYKSLHQSISAHSASLAPRLKAHIFNLQFKEALVILEQIEEQILGSNNE